MVRTLKYFLERETRFELATSTLARLHSTTELFPLVVFVTAANIPELAEFVNKKNSVGFIFPDENEESTFPDGELLSIRVNANTIRLNLFRILINISIMPQGDVSSGKRFQNLW